MKQSVLEKTSLIRKWLWIAVSFTIVTLAVGLIGKEYRYGLDGDNKKGFRPAFELTDHTGKMRTEKDFADQWMLIFFGFVNCPDICPTTLAELAVVMEGLGNKAKEVQPLFISIDSDRDIPEVLAKFISAFRTDIIGLTGTSEQIAKTARSFFIYYTKTNQDNASDSYMMSHSSQLFLFDRQGYYVKAYPYGTLAEDILADLQDKIS